MVLLQNVLWNKLACLGRKVHPINSNIKKIGTTFPDVKDNFEATDRSLVVLRLLCRGVLRNGLLWDLLGERTPQLRKCLQPFPDLRETIKLGVGQKKGCRIFIHESGEAAQINIRHARGQGRLGAPEFPGKHQQG
jgi:hypothetical protein